MPSSASAFRNAFQTRLIRWFETHRRDLPWRIDRTPYRVWISELMLQQTRADQAAPYFTRFIRRFPTVESLAGAPRDEVLKHWEGLGYYSRAVRAHETAVYIVRERGGRFPDTYDGLLQLPGVGPYTAAAVASLAFGLDHAVLDGNVIRVLTRVWAVEDIADLPATRKRLQSGLDELLPIGRAALFNEAMMELGALVCTPTGPDCGHCPLSAVCRAYAENSQTRYPVRKPKKKVPHRHVGAGVILDSRGRILIARRREGAMLGGLWEFPGGGVEKGESHEACIARELMEELGLEVRVGPHLITVPHAFSHFTMDLHAYWVRILRGRPKALHCAEFKWVAREDIAGYALPRADQKILSALMAVERPPVF